MFPPPPESLFGGVHPYFLTIGACIKLCRIAGFFSFPFFVGGGKGGLLVLLVLYFTKANLKLYKMIYILPILGFNYTLSEIKKTNRESGNCWPKLWKINTAKISSYCKTSWFCRQFSILQILQNQIILPQNLNFHIVSGGKFQFHEINVLNKCKISQFAKKEKKKFLQN